MYIMPKSRLAALRERKDRLFNAFQMFCMKPDFETFMQISALDSIRGEDGFDAWRLACLYKYGADWELSSDPANARVSIDSIYMAFNAYETDLCEKALSEPTRGRSLQVLHVFFATGELKYIELFYQCMGHEGLKFDSRVYLVKVFKTTRDMYRARAADYLSADPDHFTKLELSPAVMGFTYFDDIKKKYVKVAEDNKTTNGLFVKTPDFIFDPPAVNASARTPKKPEYLTMPDQIYGVNC